MADVIEWGKQLQAQLKEQAEWQVVKAVIQVITKSPTGEIGIHNLEYQAKKEEGK